MEHKINDIDNYEPIIVSLKHGGIAWKNKVDELISECGMSKEEAEEIASEPFELELYYEKGTGLFAVETAAAENGGFFSPYSKEEYTE